jgi:hypothetical protein
MDRMPLPRPSKPIGTVHDRDWHAVPSWRGLFARIVKPRSVPICGQQALERRMYSRPSPGSMVCGARPPLNPASIMPETPQTPQRSPRSTANPTSITPTAPQTPRRSPPQHRKPHNDHCAARQRVSPPAVAWCVQCRGPAHRADAPAGAVGRVIRPNSPVGRPTSAAALLGRRPRSRGRGPGATPTDADMRGRRRAQAGSRGLP